MLVLVILLLVIALAVILLPSARQDALRPCVLARDLCWVEIL